MKFIEIIFLTLAVSFLGSNCLANNKLSNGINNYEYLPNPGKPVLILSHPMDTDLTIWNETMPFLRDNFTILRYDLRGQGHSKVTKGPYTLELLGNDVIKLLDSLEIKEAYFCGVSISGYIAQWLAVNRPDRIKKIVISNAGYSSGDLEAQKFFKKKEEEMIKNGSNVAVKWLIDAYFSKDFMINHKERFLEIRKIGLSLDKNGLANGISVFNNGIDFTNKLSKITIPVLIIQGKDDQLVAPSEEIGKFMHSKIKNSELKMFEGKHVPSVEYPKEYSKAITEFFNR